VDQVGHDMMLEEKWKDVADIILKWLQEQEQKSFQRPS
jgi:hypothetical protein